MGPDYVPDSTIVCALDEDCTRFKPFRWRYLWPGNLPCLDVKRIVDNSWRNYTEVFVRVISQGESGRRSRGCVRCPP